MYVLQNAMQGNVWQNNRYTTCDIYKQILKIDHNEILNRCAISVLWKAK